MQAVEKGMNIAEQTASQLEEVAEMCIRDRGYTMLLQGEELSPEQEEYVEKILFNTQRLSGLGGNILLLSKLENQNIPMKKTEYRLDEQIRQAFLSPVSYTHLDVYKRQ